MNIFQPSPNCFPDGCAYIEQISPPESVKSNSSDVTQSCSSYYQNNWEVPEVFPEPVVEEVETSPEPEKRVREVDPKSNGSANVKEDDSKKVARNVCPTICAICGVGANGYHYEVPSCNGCKTFFRRTILSQKKHNCMRGGKCFDVVPRQKPLSCRSCRFRKCVEVGMNPFAIQTSGSLDENTLVSKIVTKRKVTDSEEPTTSKMPWAIYSMDQNMEKLIDGLVYLEIKVNDFRKCSFNPPNQQFNIKLDVLLNQHSLISLADRYEPMPNWPLPKFTPEEWMNFRNDQNVGKYKKYRKEWFTFDIITTIEYTKTFPFMNEISRSDRILLLKSVVVKLKDLFQAYYSYESKYAIIYHPDGSTPPLPKDLGETLSEKEFLSTTSAAILALMRIQLDNKEYVLFKAIVLCDSSVPGISDHCREVVSREKNKFSNALLKYCLVQRGAYGPAHYAACLALSHVLENHQKKQKDMHCLMRVMRHPKFPSPPSHQLIDDVMEEVLDS